MENTFQGNVMPLPSMFGDLRSKGLLMKKEACKYLAVSTRVLNKLIELGIVSVYKRIGGGNAKYFLPSELDHSLAEYKEHKLKMKQK